jgi:hypothetical protein
MDISLNSKLIHVKLEKSLFTQPWIQRFLRQYSEDLLFLPRAIMVFFSEAQIIHRHDFLLQLTKLYAKKEHISIEFIQKSLIWSMQFPIKLELIDKPREEATIFVYAEQGRIRFSFERINFFLSLYFQSQFSNDVISFNNMYVHIHNDNRSVQSRINRVLEKRNILHYKVKYEYDEAFVQNMFEAYRSFTFEGFYTQAPQIANPEHKKYYDLLECDVGVSEDEIKESYKRLAKLFHPDTVMGREPEKVEEYTQKFQHIREAYEVLTTR